MRNPAKQTTVKYEFKHRITGAVAITLFSIIVIPAVLDDSHFNNRDNFEQQTQNNGVDFTQQEEIDSQVFVSAVKPMQSQDEVSKPVLLGEKEAVAEQSVPLKEGWIVTVGTFAKPENVELVKDKLKDKGFTVQQTKVETDVGSATRVWIGPYADKESAQADNERLTPLIGEKGWITKLST